jgi:outer membrane usher protein
MRLGRLIVVVAIALIPAAAAAAPADPEPEQIAEAPFTLTVNHVKKDDVIVVLRGHDVFIDRADLRAAGITVEGGEEAELAGRKLLRLGSVSPPLRYELDEKEIALRIFAPAELLPHHTIDLQARPPDIVYTRDASAFLNYAPRLDDEGHLDLYEETGVSIDGALLFSSTYLSNTRAPVRGMTNLVLDDRPRLLRYTFGDALVRTGALGSGGFIGGVSIARNYDLDPYALKTPGVGFAGSTTTPATLDVLVNGTRVRSEPIAPGTFEIDNLQVGGGSGVAGYVIRDIFGQEHYLTEPFYISTTALSPGYEEYSYALGFVRHAVGAQSWDYNEPAAFAFHRRGLDEHFTAGGRAEASTGRLSLGPSLTTLWHIGQVDLDVAASYDRDGDYGGAAQLDYSYNSRVLGFAAGLRLTSDRYSNVGLAPEEDRATVDANAVISVPVGAGVTLAYRTSFGADRDGGVVALQATQASVRITNSLNWLTSASRAKHSGEPADWEVTTSLSLALTHGYSAQAGWRLSPDHQAVRLDTSKSLPSGTGFGYRATTVFSDEIEGEGQVQYQSLFGRYGARYTVYSQQPRLTLDAAGALVVVPGVGVFPTLPVQGSFGVIRVPGIEGVRAYGNHQELGTTDSNGNIVIPNLISYYGNSLSIAPEDVPMEYELISSETVLAPPPRGVAMATFRVRIPHFYRGRVVVLDGTGKRVVPKYGEIGITQHGKVVTSPLGPQGEFELSELDPGTLSALIEWAHGNCTFALELPESGETVIEMGELTCKQPKAPEESQDESQPEGDTGETNEDGPSTE